MDFFFFNFYSFLKVVLPFDNLYHCSAVGGVGPLNVQGDQINMVVLFWYLVKSDLSSVPICSTSLHWTSHFLQGTRKNTVMFIWSPCNGTTATAVAIGWIGVIGGSWITCLLVSV